MRQSTSRAPPSSLIRVEVDGGQVAGPTAAAKPGTALGMGLGFTTNTSKSRLIAPCSPTGRRPGIRNLTAARLRIPRTRATLPASNQSPDRKSVRPSGEKQRREEETMASERVLDV